ncbi:MAG TPA: hypothetical protein VFK69_08205, partial [Candidatus Eisenbacteria bacterium]|nr:hypothetical protein [Candidatus Eisenbacteria bacterium]
MKHAAGAGSADPNVLIVALALAASLDSLRARAVADTAAASGPGAAPAAAAPAAQVEMPADTSRRIPGTRLRFGWSDLRLAELGFHLDRGARAGSCTWFGLPAAATLKLTRDRLDRAHFELKELSARDLDYVQDQLAREGYRRSCTDDTPPQRTCTWTGRDARVTATLSADAISADVVASVAPPAIPAAAPAALAGPAPAG